MIDMTDLLAPDRVFVGLRPGSKRQLLQELADEAAAVSGLPAKPILDSLIQREKLGTTGVGDGLAIPHGKCDGTDHLVMAVGRAGTPIDFQAIDGRPVTIIWMLASPRDMTGPHIHALARISRLMTIDKFRAALLQAKTPQEAFDVIVAQENAL